jgi:Na+/melibiose symporter-like transporter
MGTYALCGLSLGIWYGMIFIFVDLYLARGALFAPLYLLAFGVGIGASLGWRIVARWLGKKAAWSIGMVLTLTTFAATNALNPANANAWSLGALLVLNTVGFASFELLPASILGDVADYSLLKSGRNQTAIHFSAYMFLTKVLFALGGSIGLAVAAWLGFDPHVAKQTGHGVFALQVVMSWLPCILMMLGLFTMPHIPMDERRHAIVRRRLVERERRADRRFATNVAGPRVGVVTTAGPA